MENAYSVIFTLGRNGEFGDLNSINSLPWPRNRHDNKNFRRITSSGLLSNSYKQNMVAMGLKTWPMYADRLAGRIKVVVSKKNEEALTVTRVVESSLLRRNSSSAFNTDLLTKLANLRLAKGKITTSDLPKLTANVSLEETNNIMPDIIVPSVEKLFEEYDKLDKLNSHLFIVGGKQLIESCVEYRKPTWIYVTQLGYVGHPTYDLVDVDKQVLESDRFLYLNLAELLGDNYILHSVNDFEYMQDGEMHDIQFSLHRLKNISSTLTPPSLII